MREKERERESEEKLICMAMMKQNHFQKLTKTQNMISRDNTRDHSPTEPTKERSLSSQIQTGETTLGMKEIRKKREIETFRSPFKSIGTSFVCCKEMFCREGSSDLNSGDVVFCFGEESVESVEEDFFPF